MAKDNKSPDAMPSSQAKIPFSRRRMLAGTFAVAATAAAPFAWRQWHSSKEIWISAQGIDANEFGLGWIDPQRIQAKNVLSSFRGHGTAQHTGKPGHVLLMSRRPGTIGLNINVQTGEIEQQFECAPHHHLQGHACFSADGQYLFTSESNYQTGEGKIVVRDGKTFQLLESYSSHGIEPHEFKLMPDKQTLVIANGGLRTHPNQGRTPLNLDTMDSSLVYLNLNNGALISQHRVPENKASIRHLDVAKDGTVAIAMQIQRTAAQHDITVALGAIHLPHHNELTLLSEPEPVIHRMNDYMGSVAIHETHRIAGFTSPRGNIVAFWHLDDNRPLSYYTMHDVCGITVSQDQRYFVISNSSGQIRQLHAHTLKEDRTRRMTFKDMHWDNHLTSMQLPRETQS